MNPPDDLPAELPVESLRRLARGLVLERGAADDLVQDAWLAALEAGGAELFAGCPRAFPTADRGGWAIVHIKNAEEDSLHAFG